MKNYTLLFAVVLILSSCAKKNSDQSDQLSEEVEVYENYPAEGFDVEGSDPLAIVLADKAMEAMGGRKAWDETRYLSWNFFNARTLVWDKWKGDVRIDFLKEDLKIIVNIHDLKGKVMKGGQELTNTDSLTKYLTKGKDVWINDSYWLVMPFNLKDSGVTLSYLKEDTTLTGKQAHILELVFKDVGVTPENYYEVWIDPETNLVCQWAFYRTHAEPEANFVLPWEDYKQYGKILLSGNRGKREVTDIKVLESIPENTFTTFETVVL